MPKLNKPAKPGYQYAHPGETSGESYAPHPKERVFESQASDIERMQKGLDPNKESPAQTAARRNAPQGNLSSKDAAGRAILRSAGRAGVAALAPQLGLEIGSEIERRTGVGKKFVDESGLGDAVERAVKRSHEGVRLTPEARERVFSGETEGMKRGGKVKPTASSRGDGIAKRGKTRGRYL